MRHYTLQIRKGKKIHTVHTKAKTGPAAKAKAAKTEGEDPNAFSIKRWVEKGRGGKTLRERNYTTPLEKK